MFLFSQKKKAHMAGLLAKELLQHVYVYNWKGLNNSAQIVGTIIVKRSTQPTV